jgi:hypothetical protein
MTSFSLVRGRKMRATKVSACGDPVLGAKSVVTSSGFVSITYTPNVETGETITVTNANGDRCVNDVPDAKFTHFGVAASFCGVNPELLNLMTGQKIVFDGDGNPVGFRQSSRVANVAAFALETWTGVAGQDCGVSGNEKFGYSVAPFIKGGTIGDITFQNGAVDFTLANATTRDGTGWGVGPYDVVLDDTGAESPLLETLDQFDHLHLQITEVPPPDEDDDSATALGVPATTLTAGTPGTLTPSNSYPPADLAALQASAVTKSPTTAWVSGTYVTLGDGSKAHWTGTAWAAGAA